MYTNRVRDFQYCLSKSICQIFDDRLTGNNAYPTVFTWIFWSCFILHSLPNLIFLSDWNNYVWFWTVCGFTRYFHTRFEVLTAVSMFVIHSLTHVDLPTMWRYHSFRGTVIYNRESGGGVVGIYLQVFMTTVQKTTMNIDFQLTSLDSRKLPGGNHMEHFVSIFHVALLSLYPKEKVTAFWDIVPCGVVEV